MKCKYFDCGWCYAPVDVVTSASSCGSCIYPEHCPYLKTEITNQQPEVISSGTAIISDENGVPTKVHLSDKEKLTEMTKKINEPSGWNPVFEFPLDEPNTIIIDGVKYKRIEDTQPFYDKLWKLLKTKLGDSVECDYMADQVRDLIREHIPRLMENRLRSEYISGYNQAIEAINRRLFNGIQ